MVDMRYHALSDVIAYYLEHIAPGRLKPSTLNVADCTLKMWRKALGPKLDVNYLTTGKIVTVRDRYPNPATANRVVSVLSQCLDMAVERDWLEQNPCKRIQPLRVRNDNVGVLISREHEARLKAWAWMHDRGLYVAMCISFENGARLGELQKLQATCIDVEQKRLVFVDTKNGDDRIVPASNWLLGILNDHGLPGKLNRRHWNACVASCRPFDPLVRFHDIRHTMITRALDRGVPVAVLGKLVGHKTLAMTLRYMQSETDALRYIVDNNAGVEKFSD